MRPSPDWGGPDAAETAPAPTITMAATTAKTIA